MESLRQWGPRDGSFAARIQPILATIALCVCAVLPSWAAGLQNSAWPMFHKDAAHTARSLNAIPTSPVVVWSSPLADSADYSSPAIDLAGNLYIGDMGKDLRSFAPNGNLRWTFHAGGNFRRSSPAIAEDGTIYIGSADRKLYAINPNGTLKWTYTTAGSIRTAPAVGADGSVYFGSDDGKVYAVRATGTLKWSFATGDSVRSSPTLVADTLLVVGSNDGSAYGLRTASGALAWEGFTGGPIKSSPAVGQGADVIVPSQDGFIYAIRHNGTLSWATFTGDTHRSSPAIGITGKIYLGVDTDLVCLHDEGDVSWTFPTGGTILSSPAIYTRIADGAETILVGSDDGYLYAVMNGVLLWRRFLGAAIHSSPAIGANGRIYVGGNDGLLYAFGSATTDVEDTMVSGGLVVGPSPLPRGESLRLAWSNPIASSGTVRFFTLDGRSLGDVAVSASTSWDARDSEGRPLPAGVYYYRWQHGTSEGKGRIAILH